MRLHGCFNRKPYKKSFWYKDGLRLKTKRDSYGVDYVVAEQIMKEYPFRNTPECQHTKGEPNDPHCGDCRWKGQL